MKIKGEMKYSYEEARAVYVKRTNALKETNPTAFETLQSELKLLEDRLQELIQPKDNQTPHPTEV